MQVCIETYTCSVLLPMQYIISWGAFASSRTLAGPLPWAYIAASIRTLGGDMFCFEVPFAVQLYLSQVKPSVSWQSRPMKICVIHMHQMLNVLKPGWRLCKLS